LREETVVLVVVVVVQVKLRLRFNSQDQVMVIRVLLDQRNKDFQVVLVVAPPTLAVLAAAAVQGRPAGLIRVLQTPVARVEMVHHTGLLARM